ncbi:RluA family pseudouridine synthase [Treponema socranskii]|uniref:RluA family pseudouridine synthase n=1 Tax=Treponema socranskii TaxID=53419 RepID=UPI003D8B96D4
MDFTDFAAGSDDGGRRVDRVLRRFLHGANLSSVYGALRKGLILVNARRVKPDARIESGDVISIASFLLQNENSSGSEKYGTDIEKDSHEHVPTLSGDKNTSDSENNPIENRRENKAAPLPYTVIFANEHFLVIDKPYGVAVQEKNSIAEKIAAYYVASVPKEKRSLSFVAGPLHRLDRNTTGILFFSWSLEGAAWFSRELKAHRIRKKYIALIHGTMESECVWEDFIKKNDEPKAGFYTVRVVSGSTAGAGDVQSLTSGAAGTRDCNAAGASVLANDACAAMHGAKRALTKAKPLCRASYKGRSVTLAEYEIETGRMHQIRAQSAFHGFPLLGDTAYGGSRIDEARAFFLHAYEVHIGENPVGLPPVITSSLPAAFESFNDKILPNWRKSFIL